MRTRTKGILLEGNERIVNKQHRGERLFARLGRVSQEEAEAWLRREQDRIDKQAENQAREGADQLFRVAAGKYLAELRDAGDVRSLETISGHVLLLNEWVGDTPLHAICNDAFAKFKADRMAGRARDGAATKPVSPTTVNRSLEVARTVCNRAARVWRTAAGKPWLGAAPLIEMLDEDRRPPCPLDWAQQRDLIPQLPGHLQRMVLFALNTGARDANICGLRWAWERQVPELGRSVFVIPAEEFKGKRPHVLVLNDVAWRIVERERGKHQDFVFVWRREREVHLDKKPAMPYQPIGTMNNTAFQSARAAVGLQGLRVHDLRHTFGQRLRDAGVSPEDRALLMGHKAEDMPSHYAAATVGRLVEMANKASAGQDRTTLLRLVSEQKVAQQVAQKKTG